MAKYRKKPVMIDAMQYDGQLDGYEKICEWAYPIEIIARDGNLIIPTLEGEMRAGQGDFIIQGVKGELYPCKPDIFEMIYEKV